MKQHVKEQYSENWQVMNAKRAHDTTEHRRVIFFPLKNPVALLVAQSNKDKKLNTRALKKIDI